MARTAAKMKAAPKKAAIKPKKIAPKKVVCKDIGNGLGYGWASEHPADLALTLKKAIIAFDKLKKKYKIEAIAFSGSSGAAIAFPLSITYELPLIYVRKTGEKSHGHEVECNNPSDINNYMIVDDFVSSGATVRHIIESIKKAAKKHGKNWAGPECMGVFTFNSAQPNATHVTIDDDGGVVDIFRAQDRK